MIPSLETTPEHEIGADLPLTEDIANRAFANPHDLEASIICAMSQQPSPRAGATSQVLEKCTADETVLGNSTYLHTAEQHTDHPCYIGDGSTLRRSTVGPFRAGRLEITIHSWAGPQSTVESQADIVLRAPARTIEAIKYATHTKAWKLHYGLSVPYWKNDVILVECCIKVPPNLMDKISDITSLVKSLSEVAKSVPEAGHSEFIILVNTGANEIGEDSEGGEEDLYE